MALANVDLPEPDDPKITVARPGKASKFTPFRIGFSRLLARAIRFSIFRRPTGVSASTLLRPIGWKLIKVFSLVYASLLDRKLGLVPTNKSIGAKARVIKTLPAIMAPTLTSP